MTIIPIILSGGSGSRLWPVSRDSRPKPFLKLPSGRSFLQETYLRASSLFGVEEVLIVTNKDLFSQTSEDLSLIDAHPEFILEPASRNTAPAIAAAALYVLKKFGGDAILLVLPADHLITDENAFYKAVKEAVLFTAQNKVVVFGAAPSGPETAYGYIQAKNNKVLRFIEKPSIEKATEYFISGDFLWNLGIFCVCAKTLIEEFYKYCPETIKAVEASFNGIYDTKPINLSKDYSSSLNQSIDVAVIEKSDQVMVVPCEIGWSDIGSWITYGNLNASDLNGNQTSGDVVIADVKDCIVHSTGRLIAALGVDDLIIVEDDDALLVAHKSRAQDVKTLYQQLKDKNHHSYNVHREVRRSWGSYTVLEEGPGFKVKRILVHPRKRLSLQKHQHRSEHWVVVSGSAEVINDGQLIKLSKNQSTFITKGHWHQLINSENDFLEVIEVQTGQYLEEDDIERKLAE